MCGICGIVDWTEQPDLPTVLAMMGELRHRGPDGCGYARDETAVLGHTRLAIIDQAGGAQPLSHDGLWITFNGEVFNYIELREELRAAGHRFRTASDTEVIVHAWQEWGERCFEKFNGQWALAIWDRERRRLVLSRDRMGVRPLYYARRGGGIAFASEVKALLRDPAVPRRLDPVGLDQTLTYWSTVAPRTVFEGIDQLRPGHWAVVDAGTFVERPYWRIGFPAAGDEPTRGPAGDAAELRERIVAAARLRFTRSDVPVGAYLSGGIDSSVTAGVVARYTDSPLQTFSLRFADQEFDEGGYQRLLVQRLGAEHHEVVVGPGDIAAVFPDVVRHAETPLLRAAPAPLFLLSRLVRESGFKVVVTGEGADEVLAGYDIFREARVRQFWARSPGSPARARAAELLYPWLARSPGAAPAFARSFFARNLDPADPAMSHRPRWDSTGEVKSLLTDDVRRAAGDSALLSALPADAAGWDPLARAQWLEMTTLLAGYILAPQGDRMLMANSVEGRFPFLDRDVVDFANTLPAHRKLFGLEEKYLLKRAFADLVPPEILRRPKQPYRAPDAGSFLSGHHDWVDEATSPRALREAGIFDPQRVALLMRKGRRLAGRPMGNTDNMRILAVLSTQLLHQQFLQPPGPAPEPFGPMTIHDQILGRAYV